MLCNQFEIICRLVSIAALPFAIWQLYIALAPGPIGHFIEKETKFGETQLEKVLQLAYLCWIISAFFFVSVTLAILLSLTIAASSWMLKQKWYTHYKIFALKAETIISIIILWRVFKHIL